MSEAYTPGSDGAQDQYNWAFQGRVVVLDHGAVFATGPMFKKYMQLPSFAVVTFDPANKLAARKDILELEEFQHIDNILLGDGLPVTYHACLNNNFSSSLLPIEATINEADEEDSELKVNKILTQLEMPSIRLDDIDDLQALDIAIFDDLHDNIAILENGEKRFSDTLLIDIQIPFKYTHERQSDFCQVSYWMAQRGFEFYRFQTFKQHTRLPLKEPLEYMVMSQMLGARAIFMPKTEKLQQLSDNQLVKLSFVLHTVYQLRDLAYFVLNLASPEKAREYLVSEGILWPVDKEETEFFMTSQYSPDIWVV